jgi:glutamine synthetase
VLNTIVAESLDYMAGLIDDLAAATARIEKELAKRPADVDRHGRHIRDRLIPAMEAAREICDGLEERMPADLWPLPTYTQMLFDR